MARGLLALGVEKGDRVGIWAPNCAEWFAVQYATARIGAILVNINPAYRTHELGYVLRQAGIGTLVVGARVQDQRLSRDDRRGPAGRCPRCGTSSISATPPGTTLLAGGAAVDAEDVRGAIGRRSAFDDPINIQYTSGTTGFPKGATLSHHNILNNGYFVGEICGYTEQDRICVPVPFYHCFGMVMGNLASTSHGACVVIPAPGFDPRGDAAGRPGRAVHARCTASPRCSSPSWRCPTSRVTTSPRCAPASWPARRARSRS